MTAAHRKVAVDVAALETMSLKELRAEWERRYGAPPMHRSAELIRRVLAWRIQADIFGGFDAVTLRMLGSGASSVKAAPVAGTRLAREWAGRRHEVIVEGECVRYEGQSYRSLSEVARLITGKRWNGPRFFGLREVNVR